MVESIGPAILVIGDVMLDRRVEGEMRAISPEAPAPIVQQREVSLTPGGAANVAVNIASLGATPLLLGVVGRDANGKALRDCLATLQISCNLADAADGITTTRTRITVDGQQVLRINEDSGGVANDAALIAGFDTVFANRIADVRLIVISDYAKKAMSSAVIAHVVGVARQRGLPVFVDAKPQSFQAYAGVAVLKPNLSEATTWLDAVNCVHPVLGLPEAAYRIDKAQLAVRELQRQLGVAAPVVTCDGDGAVYIDPAANTVACSEATAHHVADTTGAGDTFLAALAVAFLEGLRIDRGVYFANVAAGLAVQEHGVYAVPRDKVDAVIRANIGWAAKLVVEHEAVRAALKCRESGKAVVLANGCFDGLHAGHIEMLRAAKREGALLLVAYNDDASLVALKGSGRPIVPDSYRASHLAQLDAVDYVFRFDGDMEALVRRVPADVLVKGADAAGAAVPGADYVASRHGRVVFVPVLFDIRSSRLTR